MKVRAILSDFSGELETRQGQGQHCSGITGIASKAAVIAVLIAGVMSLWGNLRVKEVRGEAMHYAITLATYYLNEATIAQTVHTRFEFDIYSEMCVITQSPDTSGAQGRTGTSPFTARLHGLINATGAEHFITHAHGDGVAI